MYRLVIEMEDNTSFDASSAIESIKPIVGDNAIVKAFPINNTAQAHLKFAISELMVHDILDAYFELYPHLYKVKADEIKASLLDKISDTIDSVEKEILNKLE